MSYPCLTIRPHLSAKVIKKRYASCTHAVEKIHWQAIWLLARDDNPLKAEQVSDITGLAVSWVRELARRYNKEGPTGLEDKRKYNGNELLLNAKQLQEIETKLEKRPVDGGLWTGAKVAKLIGQYLPKGVSNVTGWKYLRRLDYTLQVPRQRHNEAATEEEMEAYKKNCSWKSKNNKNSTPTKQSKHGRKTKRA